MKLRATPHRNLDSVTKGDLIRRIGAFDAFRNPDGPGIVHRYEVTTKGTVRDRATDLEWQRGGSRRALDYPAAERYVRALNQPFLRWSRGDWAGGWRLPTLDEAALLLQREPNEFGLHIAGVFDARQACVWTADKETDPDQPGYSGAGFSWMVNFKGGDIGFSRDDDRYHVRAVRGTPEPPPVLP